MSRRSQLVLLIFLILVAAGFYFMGFAGGGAPDELDQEGHFVTADAADPNPTRDEEVYQSILTSMRDGYADSDDPSAAIYTDWTRFNSAPYRSATHGERFVNNYGNALAADYKSVKQGKAMPVGAILAKDSFAMTADGDIYAQSLFLMEKLPAGSSKPTGDWRYVMITPSGEVHGDTRGENPTRVDFCHNCHRSVANTDYLFYIPKAYRTEP